MATLTFLGAARTVTGSKHLLEADGQRLLIDCGQFQGLKELRRRNWAAFPIHPASLHAVVLTHAHIDHSGLLPRLVAGGFHGPIYCTRGTADLCSLVLPDAGRLQEEDARLANRHRFSRHTPAMPLFTEADAYQALSHIEAVDFDRRLEVAPDLHAEFTNAGHLLGSAYVRVSRPAGSAKILFGGDLGRYGRPVLPDPSAAPAAETLVLESTYGDRVHADADEAAQLEKIVRETVDRGGRVIIPAFAVGRAEEVLYWLKKLEDTGRLRPLPVYLDSPMAVAALNFYARHDRDLDPDVRSGTGEISAYATKRFQPVVSARESRELVESRGPAIVISASGMATGGRVLHHLAAALPDPRNTVLFVGYQAEGTRGRSLLEGATSVKIHGMMVAVAAHIAKVDSMSAHADSREIARWLDTFKAPPKQIYLVHGEPAVQDVLKKAIDQRGWAVHIPRHEEKVEVPL
ncbi:MAG: MBL fold metallo-hydrolase [Vicinamibacterales bacterium]